MNKKQTVNNEDKFNDDETINKRRASQTSSSGPNVEDEDDDVSLINKLEIIKYLESTKGVAHVKFLKNNDEKNITLSSMMRKIKMKSRKKTSKGLLSNTTKQTTTKVCYVQYH